MPTNKWVEALSGTLTRCSSHNSILPETRTIRFSSRAKGTDVGVPRVLRKGEKDTQCRQVRRVGYRYDWSKDEAFKNCCGRTQRQYLHKCSTNLGKMCGLENHLHRKSTFRLTVFSNETMDATHLAEFHQVEGFVADRGLA